MNVFYVNVTRKTGWLPEEVKWLISNFEQFNDFRWFHQGSRVEIHILNKELEVVYKLKFRNDTN